MLVEILSASWPSHEKKKKCAHLNLLLPYDGCVDRAGGQTWLQK